MSSSSNPSHNSSRSGPPRSADSMSSVGIGDLGVGSSVAKMPTADLPCLVPEGATVVREPVYDSMVFLIYCAEHDQLAVIPVDRCRCTWLPFVVLPEGSTWEQASHDGVALLIGRNDAEMDAEEAERTRPIYQMSYLHILRLQLPGRRFCLRITRFVRLQKSEFFRCCQNTDRVNWLPFQSVLLNTVAKLWGPELPILTSMLVTDQPRLISEFTLANALYFLDLDDSAEQRLLQSAGLQAHHVHEIYADYVEHCYPAFYMCFESFRAYLLRYGWPRDETRLTQLYQTFRVNNRPFVDFHEFLVGLVVLEPTTSSQLESRCNFVFRYYDNNQTGYLTSAKVATMVRDANPTWADAKVNAEVSRLCGQSSQLSFEDFVQSVQSELDTTKLHPLCRSPQSILSQISALLAARNEERVRLATDGVLRAKRPPGKASTGTCWACRPQQYEYGNHCVTIDTAGRAMEPCIMTRVEYQPHSNGDQTQANQAQSQTTSMTRSRYSLEYVFTIGSIPNLFIDLVRDFAMRGQSCSPNAPLGLMANHDECGSFVKYFRLLCKELYSMLGHEDKLLKVSCPALVVGDLHGSLADLLQLERHFFQAFPIFAENLVFLGNYSGECGFGVECLIYLFALKLCAPNKVFLVRGTHETANGTRTGATTSSALQQECLRKYGSTNGRTVYDTFGQLFARLPVAVVLDDTVLCTHSGIPSSCPRLTKLMTGAHKLPRDMINVERDSPAAFEMITRCPRPVRPPRNITNTTNNTTTTNNTVTTQETYNNTNLQPNEQQSGNRETTPVKEEQQSQPPPPSVAVQPTEKTSARYKKSIGGHKYRLVKSKKVVKSKPPTTSPLMLPVESKSVKLKTSSPSPPNIISASASPTSASHSDESDSFAINISLSPQFKQTEEKSKSPTLEDFENKVSTMKTLKPVFLKTLRTVRKTTKLKAPPAQKSRRSGKSGDSSLASFERAEFVDFMRVNDLSFVVRSHYHRSPGPAPGGFRLDLGNNCATVFSCSHLAPAAVALVDASSQTIRFVRLDRAPGPSTATGTVTTVPTDNTNTNTNTTPRQS